MAKDYPIPEYLLRGYPNTHSLLVPLELRPDNTEPEPAERDQILRDLGIDLETEAP